MKPAPSDDPPARPGAAVLRVNDDPGALFALRTVLADVDAEIVTAASGEQALLRLLRQDFSLMLMDVKMAGLDGFETARLIRCRPRTRETPIVFLTSHRATDLTSCWPSSGSGWAGAPPFGSASCCTDGKRR